MKRSLLLLLLFLAPGILAQNLTGDFNVDQTHDIYLTYTRSGVLTETWRSPNEISWHESHGGDFPAEVRFSDWTARTLSDHFPVIVKVQL